MDDEDVGAADVFVYLDGYLAVAERRDRGIRHRDAHMPGDVLRQSLVRVPGEHFYAVWHLVLLLKSSKWLGREDSNLQMGDPKSPDLPFVDAP